VECPDNSEPVWVESTGAGIEFGTSVRSYNRRSNRNFSFFLTGSLPKHHAEAGRVNLYKGYFYSASFPALLKELSTTLASRKKRKKVVSAGSRGTTLSNGPKVSQRPRSMNSGNRKAKELANSGGSTELAHRRSASDTGSAPLPASSVTCEQAGLGSRQFGPPEDGMTGILTWRTDGPTKEREVDCRRINS